MRLRVVARALAVALAATTWPSVGWSQEAGMPAPGPARVVGYRVEPAVYRGACPVTLRFTGEIEKGSWGIVEYHWARSDRTRTPIESIDFPYHAEYRGPPRQRVTMTWQVDPEPGEKLWAEIVIDSPPGDVRTGEAVAEVTCTSRRSVADPCAAMAENGPITSLVRQCAAQRYEAAEARLSRLADRFESTLAPADDPTNDVVHQAEIRRREAFRDSQALWRQFRQKACEEAYLEYFLGSMAPARRLECLRELTEERARYLERRLESDPVGSE